MKTTKKSEDLPAMLVYRAIQTSCFAMEFEITLCPRDRCLDVLKGIPEIYNFSHCGGIVIFGFSFEHLCKVRLPEVWRSARKMKISPSSWERVEIDHG